MLVGVLIISDALFHNCDALYLLDSFGLVIYRFCVFSLCLGSFIDSKTISIKLKYISCFYKLENPIFLIVKIKSVGWCCEDFSHSFPQLWCILRVRSFGWCLKILFE